MHVQGHACQAAGVGVGVAALRWVGQRVEGGLIWWGGQEGGGASLTGYLRLDGGLLAAAQQLRLDGLHHTLEAPAGS